MQRIRQIHLWLGVFFTPLVVFFAFTGVLQTFDWHETPKNGTYHAPAWIVKLAQVHKHQRLARGPDGSSPLPLKFLVAAMSVGLILTSVLGYLYGVPVRTPVRVGLAGDHHGCPAANPVVIFVSCP